MLKDEVYQGLSVAERVADNENRAIKTMVSYWMWQNARTKNIPADAQIAAWEAAKDILESFFSHRSQNVILAKDGFTESKTPNNFGPPVAAGATTTFKRNPQYLLGAESVARYQGVGGTLEQNVFTTHVRKFDQIVLSYGSQTNDVAAANAAAFAVYAYFYSGVKLNQKQYDWLHAEMVKDLKADRQFQLMNDQVRQRMYETLGSDAIHLSNQQPADSMKKQADCEMKKIFAPRNLDDYTLKQDGFARK